MMFPAGSIATVPTRLVIDNDSDPGRLPIVRNCVERFRGNVSVVGAGWASGYFSGTVR